VNCIPLFSYIKSLTAIMELSTSSLRPLRRDFPCVKSPPGGAGVGCIRTPCKVPYKESEKASRINHTVHRQKSWFTRISRLSRIRLSIRVSVRISISVRISVRVRFSFSGLNLWTPMAVQKSASANGLYILRTVSSDSRVQ